MNNMTNEELIKKVEQLETELKVYKEIVKGFQKEYVQLVYLIGGKNDKN